MFKSCCYHVDFSSKCFLLFLMSSAPILSSTFQVASCEHVFCRACLINYYAPSLGQAKCPSCSKLLTVDFTANPDAVQTSKTTIKGFRSSSILNRIQIDNFQTSTKIEALVCMILINYVLSCLLVP